MSHLLDDLRAALPPDQLIDEPVAVVRPGTAEAVRDVVRDAIELGGTVTGEHGVGLLKRDGMARELSEPVLAMHRAIKAALDPHNILNPGKVM